MRSIWSGAVSFGLVLIPVKLYTAVQESSLDLDMLRKQDLCPIRYARVCRDSGEEVPYEDIVKGYQYRKGDYVVLEDEDFRRASVRKTQTIDIVEFVSEGEIDSKLLDKPYYLEPTKQARKAYALLREALKKTGKVAVGRFVLRNRERMVVLRPEGDLVVLEQMRFADEIRKPAGLDLPGKEEANERELDMAIKLIDQLTEPFHPEQFHDTYREELERVIADKARGKPARPAEEVPIPTEVPDLMARLRESLEQAKKKEAKRA
jgi:DNA end-binding protein Ku